jgi:hypothetical protein
MEERAAESVSEILRTHEPGPLPAEIQRDLKGILEREQLWIEGRD